MAQSSKIVWLCLFPFYLLGSLLTFSSSRLKKLFREFYDRVLSINFINILLLVSVAALTVGTAALVIVLSVFNGLEDLTRQLYRAYNPELKITSVKGKSFDVNPELLGKLNSLPTIKAVTEVIEDNALVRYGEAQMVVNARGVSDNFLEQYDLNKHIIAGENELVRNGQPYALLGAGISFRLSVQLQNELLPIEVWYPKRDKKLSLNPQKAFYRQSIRPGGIFSVDQKFDYSGVILPLSFMEKLLKYEGKRTSLEIKANDISEIDFLKKEVKEIVGESLRVENAEEQQASILKAVKIERLFGFITFVFILAIASFNVFFSLAMLTIEKKKDVAILRAMGTDQSFVRQVFVCEGAIIGLLGGCLGLLFGFLICWAQQTFGLVSLGVSSSVVEAYPVKMYWADFAISGVVVVVITLLAALIPAQNAANGSAIRT